MKRFSILALLLNTLLLPSQTLKGIVLDSISHETLPYASLVIKNKNNGVYSNEDGTYNFNIPKASAKDTLIISLIGYYNKKIAVTHILDRTQEDLNIQMLPKVESLDEVLINNTQRTFRNNKIKLSTGNRKQVFPSSVPFGYETATLMENPKHKKGKLVKLHLKLKDSSIDIYETYQTYYRIAFYNIDSLGFPGDLLHFENIIVKPEIHEKNYAIDLEDKGIPFTKKGIFIGIETVKPNYITLKSSMYVTTPNILHTHTKHRLKYSRFRSNDWVKHSKKSVHKEKLYAVPFIKIEMVYEKEKTK
ncbi:carboxypeptidase-like regulatory domain-containing protein [Winogradskyella sp. Asnod2-B02-A]|uniref:carboxypeptidase-like regulatory domain-containing protein n=1 Tax=Winogradskyella sp. Asnod2-B02-A TaxID=3160583 RepID=UPI0038700706